jgi:hypothetical protein
MKKVQGRDRGDRPGLRILLAPHAAAVGSELWSAFRVVRMRWVGVGEGQRANQRASRVENVRPVAAIGSV